MISGDFPTPFIDTPDSIYTDVVKRERAAARAVATTPLTLGYAAYAAAREAAAAEARARKRRDTAAAASVARGAAAATTGVARVEAAKARTSFHRDRLVFSIIRGIFGSRGGSDLLTSARCVAAPFCASRTRA